MNENHLFMCQILLLHDFIFVSLQLFFYLDMFINFIHLSLSPAALFFGLDTILFLRVE